MRLPSGVAFGLRHWRMAERLVEQSIASLVNAGLPVVVFNPQLRQNA